MSDSINISGAWVLSVQAMGQALQIKLDLQQDGSAVTGTMNSSLVKGDINGSVDGNQMNATTKTNIMGQDVELKITGNVEGDSMTGNIETGMMMLPNLPFTASRS